MWYLHRGWIGFPQSMLAAERKNILQTNKHTTKVDMNDIFMTYPCKLERFQCTMVSCTLLVEELINARKDSEKGDLDLTVGHHVIRACRMKNSAVFLFGKYSLSQHTFIT